MRWRSRIRVAVSTIALFTGAFFGAVTAASANPLAELTNSFDHGHWIAYAPTNANPHIGKQAPPGSVEADLAVLKKRGFTGVCTYGCDSNMLEKDVPAACDKLKMNLIVGVWDPNNTKNLDTAVKLANQHACVLGICIGNEGGCESGVNGQDKRYTFGQTAASINYCKTRTSKPITTCEQFEKYTNPTLMNAGDFLMPNIHPFWNKITDATRAVDFTMEKYSWIKNRTSKPVICKEVGFPTAGDGRVSEQLQTGYYKLLATKPIRFMYFEAFDGPWKKSQGGEDSVGPHWGLWTYDRKPKQIVSQLPW